MICPKQPSGDQISDVLNYHCNIVGIIFTWQQYFFDGNRNIMNHQKYYVHLARTFYKRFSFVHEMDLICS
jgi:hypothetical protein